MKIKTIILAGSRDFQGCSLTTSVAGCIWPVFGTAAVERLLAGLAEQGVDQAVLCSNGSAAAIEEAVDTSRCLKLTFLKEQFPVGSAGCIRDAVQGEKQDCLLVILQGSIIDSPNIEELISKHKQSGGEMTVFFNSVEKETSDFRVQSNEQPATSCQPSAVDQPEAGNKLETGSWKLRAGKQISEFRVQSSDKQQQAAGIYVCCSSVLDVIPDEGYFDIKESLIAELLAKGKKVVGAELSEPVHSFRGRDEYIGAVEKAFDSCDLKELKKHEKLENVFVGKDVTIDKEARLSGPVAVLDGASIEKGAIILGPAVIGQNSTVGENSIITDSVLWQDVTIGAECKITASVLADNTMLEDESLAENKSVVPQKTYLQKAPGSKEKNTMSKESSKKQNWKLETGGWKLKGSWKLAAGSCLLTAAFLWSYWPNLKHLWAMWMSSDEFSSGLLVPFIAVYILWSRRKSLADVQIKPAILVGSLGFLAAQFIRVFGTYYMFSSLERFSIVVSIIALVLLILGWRFFWKTFAVLAFLFLMLPWPNQVQASITQPLQTWATNSAVFSLEMIGYDVIQEGNIIHIGDTTVAVAEACNGLRMITAFFVIIALVVLLADRPKWQKLIVFASSLPIALLCNTIRLAITSIAFTYLEGEQWETMFHDFGGYAMMPLALAIAVGELWLLKALTTPPEEMAQPQEVVIKASSSQPPASS